MKTQSMRNKGEEMKEERKEEKDRRGGHRREEERKRGEEERREKKKDMCIRAGCRDIRGPSYAQRGRMPGRWYFCVVTFYPLSSPSPFSERL